MPLKIDVHHHIFAPFFMQAKLSSAKDVGWKTPAENLPWSLSKSLAMMDRLGIGAAVLSYPAGIPEKMGRYSDSTTNTTNTNSENEDEGGDGKGDGHASDDGRKRGRDAVRKMNAYAKELCESEEAQGRFGWFACLPDLRDVEGALSSCAYLCA